eukprot:scaffold174224_cov29-Tisochrysis_lutea.AAC.2
MLSFARFGFGLSKPILVPPNHRRLRPANTLTPPVCSQSSGTESSNERQQRPKSSKRSTVHPEVMSVEVNGAPSRCWRGPDSISGLRSELWVTLPSRTLVLQLSSAASSLPPPPGAPRLPWRTLLRRAPTLPSQCAPQLPAAPHARMLLSSLLDTSRALTRATRVSLNHSTR